MCYVSYSALVESPVFRKGRPVSCCHQFGHTLNHNSYFPLSVSQLLTEFIQDFLLRLGYK